MIRFLEAMGWAMVAGAATITFCLLVVKFNGRKREKTNN